MRRVRMGMRMSTQASDQRLASMMNSRTKCDWFFGPLCLLVSDASIRGTHTQLSFVRVILARAHRCSCMYSKNLRQYREQSSHATTHSSQRAYIDTVCECLLVLGKLVLVVVLVICGGGDL